MDPLSHSRMSSRARLLAGGALLALLCALLLSVARAHALEVEEEPPLDPNTEPPSFVVIQTDDQTLDELYAAFTPFPGAAEIRAMHELGWSSSLRYAHVFEPRESARCLR